MQNAKINLWMSSGTAEDIHAANLVQKLHEGPYAFQEVQQKVRPLADCHQNGSTRLAANCWKAVVSMARVWRAWAPTETLQCASGSVRWRRLSKARYSTVLWAELATRPWNRGTLRATSNCCTAVRERRRSFLWTRAHRQHCSTPRMVTCELSRVWCCWRRRQRHMQFTRVREKAYREPWTALGNRDVFEGEEGGLGGGGGVSQAFAEDVLCEEGQGLHEGWGVCMVHGTGVRCHVFCKTCFCWLRSLVGLSGAAEGRRRLCTRTERMRVKAGVAQSN